MKTFSINNGFTVEDMLHFGYTHINAARLLFKSNSAFLDSAGYLAHLGTEILLKSWHLHIFSQFEDIHKLETLYKKLKEHDKKIDLGAENEAFLKKLDEFYLLRYPRRNEGPIEVGSDMLNEFDKLHNSI